MATTKHFHNNGLI